MNPEFFLVTPILPHPFEREEDARLRMSFGRTDPTHRSKRSFLGRAQEDFW